MVTEPSEIIDELSQNHIPPQDNGFVEQEHESDCEFNPPTEANASVRNQIIKALGPTPVEVDDIIRFSNATPGQVQLVLIELALSGRLERHGGNRISII